MKSTLRALKIILHDEALLRDGSYIILFVFTKSGHTHEQPGVFKTGQILWV